MVILITTRDVELNVWGTCSCLG